ncbi:MAG: hypothetical protein J6Y02_14580 [Pseudobutyrivibrio sp.]|nr:hypothetical protein [Pseudobutyrivibrio sp.]
MSDASKKWKIWGHLDHDAQKNVSLKVEANGRSKAIALAEKKLSKKYPGKTFQLEGAEVVTDEEEVYA